MALLPAIMHYGLTCPVSGNNAQGRQVLGVMSLHVADLLS